jgi:hypothetical protein
LRRHSIARSRRFEAVTGIDAGKRAPDAIVAISGSKRPGDEYRPGNTMRRPILDPKSLIQY